MAERLIGESDAPTVRFETLGCKLNQADTQKMAREFAAAGYRVVGQGKDADVFVLNSCTVTHIADRKARQSARAAKRRNPGSIVVATGCYAERAPGDLDAMPEVDLVVGNRDKGALTRMLGDAFPERAPDYSSDWRRDAPAEFGEFRTVPLATPDDGAAIATALRLRSRAMVKIQEGCDQVCAYCIVPKVRGRERSIPLDEIVATANAYAAAGCQEVALTGTQLGSYGFDLPDADIRSLVEAMLARTDLPRIRISSLQPQDISDELLELWSDSRLCPHFHVPLQSGSDAVLRRMRRRYTTAEFLDTIVRIRKAIPDVSITTDAIVGFPGETNDDFRATLDACVEAELASVHVFPYSTRPGTSAAHYGEHVDPAIKSARAAELGEAARELSREHRRRFVGHTRKALWERTTSHGDDTRAPTWSGLTDNYIRTRAPSWLNLENRITDATLTAVDEDSVRAVIPT